VFRFLIFSVERGLERRRPMAPAFESYWAKKIKAKIRSILAFIF
jgi:hypothetical protein